MRRETFVPELCAILKAGRIEKKEADITSAELDIEATHLSDGLFSDDFLHAMLEMGWFWCLKGDDEKFMDNGCVDSGD